MALLCLGSSVLIVLLLNISLFFHSYLGVYYSPINIRVRIAYKPWFVVFLCKTCVLGVLLI